MQAVVARPARRGRLLYAAWLSQLLMLTLMLFSASAAVASPSIGFPGNPNGICGAVDIPVGPNVPPPGHWYSPKRIGQGWSIYRWSGSGGPLEIRLTFFTYTSEGRAIWFETDTQSFDAQRRWFSPLYKVTSTARVQAGEVSLAVTSDPRKIAVRWKRNDLQNYPDPHGTFVEECILDPFREEYIDNTDSYRSALMFSGAWQEVDNPNGRRIHIERGITRHPDTNELEYTQLLYPLFFDAMGEPAWLAGQYGPNLQSAQNVNIDDLFYELYPHAPGAAYDPTRASLTYRYLKRLEPDQQDFGPQYECEILSECVGEVAPQSPASLEMRVNFVGAGPDGPGQVRVALGYQSGGNFPVEFNGGTWHYLPTWRHSTLVPIQKLNPFTSIQVDSYACQVATGGTTCPIEVQWNAHVVPTLSVWRVNVADGQATNIANGPQYGAVTDQLAAGSRVTYRLVQGLQANGTVLDETPEVTATQALPPPVNSIGFPDVSQCGPAALVPPGTFPAFPGLWFNPERSGTGWSLNFFPWQQGGSSPPTRALFAIWYTFDAQSRPIWLASQSAGVEGDQFWSPLYRIHWDYALDREDISRKTQVGQVAFSFDPTNPERAAVRWVLDGVTTVQNECIIDLVRTTYRAPAPNAAFTGHWDEPNHGGWGVNTTIGVLEDLENYIEFHTLAVHDQAGDPTWLISEQKTTPGIPSASINRFDLFYLRSPYPGGVPVSVCTQNCQQVEPAGWFDRAFQSTTLMPAKVNATITSTLGQVVSWVRGPVDQAGEPTSITLHKLTDKDQILVNRTSCTVTFGTTCAIRVDWASDNPSVRAYRRKEGTVGHDPLAPNSPNGATTDFLTPGKYRYLLIDTSTTTELFVSPEVLVVAGGNQTPATPPAAQLKPIPTIPDSSSIVSQTEAKLEVDESGQTTIHVPIKVPPGSGGVAPSMSLAYRSSQESSYLGIGWSIGGMSSIERCRHTIEHGDNVMPEQAICPASEVMRDALCLDGQRLVRIDGTHGRQGAVYRKELDDFTRVEITEEAPNPVTLQTARDPIPTKFEVRARDGSVRTYGSGNSMLLSRGNGTNGFMCGWAAAATGDFPVSWLLHTHSDSTAQNTLTYDYGRDPAKGQIWLERVEYAGGEIEFQYQTPPGQDPAQVAMSYVGGLPVSRANKRLSHVLVRNQENQTVRTYTPTYAPAPENSYNSLVQSITECAGSACRMPVTFEWTSSSAAPGSVVLNQHFAEYFSALGGYKLGDVNGDGRLDVVTLHQTQMKINFLRQATGSVLTTPNTPSGLDFLHTNASNVIVDVAGDPARSWHLLDYNHDGKDDLLFARKIPFTNNYVWEVWPSTGEGFSPSPLDSFPALDNKTEALLLDLNGDGLTDMLVPFNHGFKALLMERRPGSPGTNPYRFARDGANNPVMLDIDIRYSCGVTNFSNFQRDRVNPVDFNGDGLVDLTFLIGRTQDTCNQSDTLQILNDEEWQEYLDTADHSRGGGYYRVALINEGVVGNTLKLAEVGAWFLGTSVSDEDERNVHWVDVNGDGLTDVVFRNSTGHLLSPGATVSNSESWHYQLNIGRRWIAPENSARQLAFTTPACVVPSCAPVHFGAKYDRFMDFDGDGRVDYLEAANQPGNEKPYHVRVWQGSQFSSTALITGLTAFDSDHWENITADFDADGTLDTLSVKTTGSNKEYRIKRRSVLATGRNLVRKLTDSLGSTTEVVYAPMGFKSVYTPVFDGPWLDSGRASPVFDIFPVPGTYLVQYLLTSAPTSAALGGTQDDKAMIRYAYHGLRVQTNGRGTLGYRRVATLDLQTGVEASTQYLQAFPLSGRPHRTESRKLSTLPGDACMEQGPDSSQCWFNLPVCGRPGGPACPDESSPTGLLKRVTDTWAWRAPHNAQNLSLDSPDLGLGAAAIFVARTSSLELNYDLDGSFTHQVQNSSDSYDAFGNALVASTATYSAVPTGPLELSSPDSIVTVESVYLNDATKWLLGRLSRSVVTHQRDVEQIVRTTNFHYDSNTGLLIAEVIEPEGGESEYLATTYHHDSRGNRIRTTSCSLHVAQRDWAACRNSVVTAMFREDPLHVHRTKRVEYDELGRYVRKEFGLFSTGPSPADFVEGEVSSVLARNALGSPTAVANANGVVTHIAYDAFGDPVFQRGADGSSTYTERAFCETLNTCPPDPALRYMVRTTTAGAPTQWAWHDSLGRVVLTVTQGFASDQFIAVRHEYDKLSRPARVSEPFRTYNPTSNMVGQPYNEQPIYWTNSIFDALGRQVWISRPELGFSNGAGPGMSYAYQGRAKVTTFPMNGNGFTQTLTEHKNALGELESTVDALGTTVSYAYDATGNLVQVARGTVTTLTPHDRLGRRTFLSDPDTGQWAYTYNAAGELVSETSPRGVCSRMQLDANGRMLARRYFTTGCSGSPAYQSTWLYDDGFMARGQLVREQVTRGDNSYLSRNMEYDALGRRYRLVTQQPGPTQNAEYIDWSTFDEHGRPFQQFTQLNVAGRQVTLGELFQYNAQGYQNRIRDAYPGTSGLVHHEVLATDNRGRVTQESRGQAAVSVERQYDMRTGRLLRILGGNGYIQDLRYDYDEMGNMRWREDQSPAAGFRENFSYDALQRLTGVVGSAGHEYLNQTYQYAANGNIEFKTGVGAMQYGQSHSGVCNQSGERMPGPHAVTSANGVAYCYDASGNQVRSSDGRRITYSVFEMAEEMRYQGKKVRFRYGPNNERVGRLDYASETSLSPTLLVHFHGSTEVEFNQTGQLSLIKRHVGGVIIKVEPEAGLLVPRREFVFTDALGSTFAVTDANGLLLGPSAGHDNRMSFDPFGLRRRALGQAMTAVERWGFNTAKTTRHGFTGHEQVDSMGLIHMNGRIYDPLLGRFLQADPFVQSPANSQSFNRYTYVFNNPLAWTDPSGYLGKKEEAWARAIVAVVISYFTGVGAAAVGGWGGAAIAAAGGAAAGAVVTGTLKGAAQGAVTALVFYGISVAANSMNQHSGGDPYGLGEAFMKGVAGGVIAELQGGQFGHGFLSAGVAPALATNIQFESDTGNFIFATLLGGSVSEATGGKFANGAVTAAFSYAFSSAASRGGSGGEGEWMFPEGGSSDINSYVGDDGTIPIYTNGIMGDRDAFQTMLTTRGAPGYFNPSHGPIADVFESIGQKFFGWAGDPLAAGFARGLAGANHPLTIIAHSQGTLTVANAVRYYGLSAQGSTFVMKSPALSHFTASRVIQGRGGTMVWRQPYGDIANIYAPSLNPLRWASGFGDILCGACRHTANGLP